MCSCRLLKHPGPGFLMWALFAPPLKVTVIGSEEPPSPATNDPTVPPRLYLSSCVPHPSLSTLPSLPNRNREIPLDGVAVTSRTAASPHPASPTGEVTVQDSFRDAVTGCTTYWRQSCVTLHIYMYIYIYIYMYIYIYIYIQTTTRVQMR